MRIWAVSDIHTDYPANLAWVRQWCASGGGSGEAGPGAAPSFRDDVLILAGDVSDSPDTLEQTLALFAAAFGHVVFVPGNHDLWVRREERDKYDSLEKLQRVRELCQRLGVHTQAVCVGGVWVVPLLSWYHGCWDREPDVPGATPITKVMLDFHVCSWTSQPGLSAENSSLACHFDSLNEPAFSATLQQIEAQAAAAGGRRPPMISFSHFLPRQELLPEKRMLYHPNLAKASGSDFLEARIRRLRPCAHVFGHTHFSWDAEIDGIRYIQWPLGYPHEQSRRRGGGAGWQPLALYDSEGGGLAPRRHCYWSDYYTQHGRDPANITAAPWASVG